MSESIRDRIARVLSTQTTCDGQACPSEVHYRQADAVLTEVPALRAIRDCEAAHEQIVLIIVGACDVGSHYAADAADEIVALFPVLAGVTDEMVETGARALDTLEWSQLEFGLIPPDQEISRAVLEAVIGKEQVDE